jgi:hypothetical protein
MSEMIDREKFAAEVGTAFVLKAAEDYSVDVTLLTVSELKERPSNRSFSIVFKVPDGYTVEQGLYDLEHTRLGSMQLFLVPVGDNRLEAVFNLLLTNV